MYRRATIYSLCIVLFCGYGISSNKSPKSATLSIQGVLDVMAVYDYVLSQIRRDHPELHTLFEKTDNASCFKNGQFMTSRPAIAAKHGFKIASVLFNEPGDGSSRLLYFLLYVHISIFFLLRMEIITMKQFRKG